MMNRSHPQYELINDFVAALKYRLESIIDNAKLTRQDPTVSSVIEKFNTEVLMNAPKSDWFYDILDQYMESAKTRVSRDIVSYDRTLKQYLQQSEQFSSIRITFVQ